MRFFRRLANSSERKSLAARLRRRRFSILKDVIERLPKPVSILDIGGTSKYWEMMDVDLSSLRITILNLHEVDSLHPSYQAVVGDARDLRQYADIEFDIVHSNSVIEHVGTLEDQFKMAGEIRRIERNYFVQTPNRNFPIEPHFLFPLFQFLPRALQVFLLRKFRLGWMKKKCSSRKEAEAQVDRIRLIRLSEFKRMFPDARIVKERFMGLTKSFIAIRS